MEKRISIADIRKADRALRDAGDTVTVPALARKLDKEERVVRLYLNNCLCLQDVLDRTRRHTCLAAYRPHQVRSGETQVLGWLLDRLKLPEEKRRLKFPLHR